MSNVRKVDFKKCQHELMIVKLLEQSICVARNAIQEGSILNEPKDIEALLNKCHKKGMDQEFKSLLILHSATSKLHAMINDVVRLISGVDIHAVNWAAYDMLQYVSEDVQDKSLEIFGHPHRPD